jgi:citrate lyase subunit beta/citryl-CoA lyase
VDDLNETVRTARTLLFVPGNRPDRFSKARDAGADLVVIDLEDAVAPDAKAEARTQAAAWAAQQPCAVRVNGGDTEWFEDDVAALLGHGCAVMLPKAEDPRVVERLADALGADAPIIGLVETARGVLQAPAVAATRGMRRLAFGSYDLAAELGVSPDSTEAMAWSRGTVVIASASAGLPPPVDGVSAAVHDVERVRRDTRLGAALGFDGKLCIHPKQVPVVHHVLRPAEEDVAWASKVVDAVAGGALGVVGGEMVDKPVAERARRILRRAKQR